MGFQARPGVPAEDPQSRYGYQENFTGKYRKSCKVLLTGMHSYLGESFLRYAHEYYADRLEIREVSLHGEDWKDEDWGQYDAVLHVAGIAHADVGKATEEERENYYRINTDLAIAAALKARRDGVSQFVLLSSVILYGQRGSGEMITEQTVPSPDDFYGDSKWQADKGVRALETENFHPCVLRLPMVYGPGCKGNYKLLSKLAGFLPVLPGYHNRRSMLYVENLCEFLCRILLTGAGGIFFPQNKRFTDTAGMLRMIRSAHGKGSVYSKIFGGLVGLFLKMPGKVGVLAGKAFGDKIIDPALSRYEGLPYCKVSMTESIARTELGEK